MIKIKGIRKLTQGFIPNIYVKKKENLNEYSLSFVSTSSLKSLTFSYVGVFLFVLISSTTSQIHFTG